MSEVYWGIVAGLGALVVTLFVCIDLVYSKSNGLPDATSGRTDSPAKAAEQSSSHGRYAA